MGYRVDGTLREDFPLDELDRAEPVYEDWEGWSSAIAAARTFETLPVSTQRYVRLIEERVGVPVVLASVGADRDATVVRREIFGA